MAVERKWRTQAASALEILAQVQADVAGGMTADRTLARIFRTEHKFGSRDRQLFSRLIFAYYRWLGWIRRFDDPRMQLLAALVTDAESPLPPVAEVWAEELGLDFETLEKIHAFCHCNQRFAACAGLDTPPEFSELVPEWTLPELAPEALADYLPELATRPPVWVRTISPEIAQKACAEWKAAELDFYADPVIENAFCFHRSRVRFEDFSVWHHGGYELQDRSSQIIGLTADPHPGEHWFDACAGGGGKTLQLAALMQGQGTVAVYDIRQHKLDDLEKRAARTPFRRMICRSAEFTPKRIFDGVLLDAPCSSSGRWRREPDARWRMTPESLEQTIRLQADLLEKAAPLVRPGGKLVYATCSLFHRENADQVTAFLARHAAEFELENMALTVPGGSRDCDGSFAAVLRRKK